MQSTRVSPRSVIVLLAAGFVAMLTPELARGDGPPPILWKDAGGRHSMPVSAVRFTHDGKTLFSADWNGTVNLWRASDGLLLGGRVTNQAVGAWDIAVPATGTSFLTVAGGVVESFQLPSLETSWTTPANGMRLALLNGGATFLVGGNPQVRRIDDGSLVREFQRFAGNADAIAMSADGIIVVGIGGVANNFLLLWRVADGALIRSVQTDIPIVNIAVSPDASKLGCTDSAGRVQIRTISDFAILRTIDGRSTRLRAISFSPDGRILATGGNDNTVRFYRMPDGAPLAVYDQETLYPQCIQFSRSGGLFAYGRYDSALVVARNEFLTADVNCDASVNAFDVSAFVLALTDAEAYQATFPACHGSNADVNGDGSVNTFDIEPFLALLGS